MDQARLREYALRHFPAGAILARRCALLLLMIPGLAGCGAAPPPPTPVLVIASAEAEPPAAPPAPSTDPEAEAPPVPPPVPSPSQPEADAPPVMEEPPAPAAPPTPPPTFRPPPALTKSFTVKGVGDLVLPGPILFETGKETLKPESDPVLSVVKAVLDARPQITRLRIEGHADSLGSGAMNQALTEKRALAVAKWLVARGVSCKRLIAVGFGSSRPIADNATAEGRAQNRRMTVVIAELSGKLMGGMAVDGGGTLSGDPCH